MSYPKPIPSHLQLLITEALTQMQQYPEHEIDHDILMQIGTAFGSLQDLPQHYTRHHQRRLLLILFTLYHLTPIWVTETPSDTTFHDALQELAALVMQRSSHENSQAVMESLWAWSERPRNADSIEHTLALSIYTLAKVIEPIFEHYTFDNYPPDVHANVALICAAESYAKYAMRQEHSQLWGRRTFWLYWLRHIVPNAWFPVSEDEMC